MRPLGPASIALLLGAAPVLGLDIATRCPEGTRPVRTADYRRPWACASERGFPERRECPAGYESAAVLGQSTPYLCVLDHLALAAPRGLCPAGSRAVPPSDRGRAYDCERAPALERFLPCPRGTRPVLTPGSLSPYRCAYAPPRSAEPAAEADNSAASARPAGAGSCPEGTSRHRTEDPFAPFQCVPHEPAAADAAGPARYRRYRSPGRVAFEYPAGWHLTDAWKDQVPSVFLFLDARRDGPPVNLAVSHHLRGRPGYEPMDAAMEKERRWRRAREQSERTVAGYPARLLRVPGESDAAYVAVPDGYFLLSYSAPPELYSRHLQAYDKLLETFALDGPGTER